MGSRFDVVAYGDLRVVFARDVSKGYDVFAGWEVLVDDLTTSTGVRVGQHLDEVISRLSSEYFVRDLSGSGDPVIEFEAMTYPYGSIAAVFDGTSSSATAIRLIGGDCDVR